MADLNKGKVKRQNVKTVDSADVQGEGSWVKVRTVSYGESKKLMRAGAGDNDSEARIEITDEFIRSHVVDWNWVGDDDEPLPSLRENPEVLDDLTADEVKFLAKALVGSVEARKN